MLPELFARLAHSVVDGSAEAVVTKFFGLLTALVVGTVSVAVAWNSRKRRIAMASIPPGASVTTHNDDDTPTREIVVHVSHSEIDHAEIERLRWERDEARRLYALAQDDLSRQQRRTLKAEALAEVLSSELADLRRAITGSHTTMPTGSPHHALHVTEIDDALTPRPQALPRRPR